MEHRERGLVSSKGRAARRCSGQLATTRRDVQRRTAAPPTVNTMPAASPARNACRGGGGSDEVEAKRVRLLGSWRRVRVNMVVLVVPVCLLVEVKRDDGGRRSRLFRVGGSFDFPLSLIFHLFETLAPRCIRLLPVAPSPSSRRRAETLEVDVVATCFSVALFLDSAAIAPFLDPESPRPHPSSYRRRRRRRAYARAPRPLAPLPQIFCLRRLAVNSPSSRFPLVLYLLAAAPALPPAGRPARAQTRPSPLWNTSPPSYPLPSFLLLLPPLHTHTHTFLTPLTA